jgi:hypothetical protein
MRPASDPATPGGLARPARRSTLGRDALHVASRRLRALRLEESEELSSVVRDTGYPLISVVGHPSEAIREEVAGVAGYEVLVPPEKETRVATALPGWEAVSATLHLLGYEPRLPRLPAGTVRLLEPSELESIDGLPSRLRSEFAVATRRSPIAASLAGGRPVAFCYSVRTESL